MSPLMTQGGSITTLTYIGATRVIPNYNVMGVAKAALESAVRQPAFRRFVLSGKQGAPCRIPPEKPISPPKSHLPS